MISLASTSDVVGPKYIAFTVDPDPGPWNNLDPVPEGVINFL